MIYLTCADQPSGVYRSQVIDVCLHANSLQQEQLRLVALISLRGYFAQRKLIRNAMPGALVLPSFPGIRRWKMNLFTLRWLFLFIGKQNCWCRGIYATQLALMLKEKGLCKSVVFDGRGAYAAEYKEYLHKELPLEESMEEMEKQCVLKSDFRLAVSEALVNYWRDSFGYSSTQHCVIPCTLAESHTGARPTEAQLQQARIQAGFSPSDVLVVYSGSHAEWQSLSRLDGWLLQLLREQPHCKVIILAKPEMDKLECYRHFPSRVSQAWLPPEKVNEYLMMADYGLLMREYTTTNRVASPTKYAEYLAAGLQVLISQGLGDFSGFTQTHHCGMVVALQEAPPVLTQVNFSKKTACQQVALEHFSKKTYNDSYRKILAILSAS